MKNIIHFRPTLHLLNLAYKDWLKIKGKLTKFNRINPTICNKKELYFQGTRIYFVPEERNTKINSKCKF